MMKLIILSLCKGTLYLCSELLPLITLGMSPGFSRNFAIIQSMPWLSAIGGRVGFAGFWASGIENMHHEADVIKTSHLMRRLAGRGSSHNSYSINNDLDSTDWQLCYEFGDSRSISRSVDL